MNEKDKQILKDGALIIADSIASKIFGLDAAWGLSKALYGAGLKLRQQKALEWVEMVRDNPTIFTEKVLQSEDFQDAFVYSFEKYISERSERKRAIIKKIFLGYAQSEDFEQFEIERMISLLSLISLKGLQLLQLLTKVSNTQVFQNDKLSEHLTTYLVKDSNDNQGKYNLPSGSNIREIWADAETDLISIGILRTYTVPRYNGSNYHDYDFTNTGKKFIKYITQE
jgi:hypothetical protein